MQETPHTIISTVSSSRLSTISNCEDRSVSYATIKFIYIHKSNKNKKKCRNWRNFWENFQPRKFSSNRVFEFTLKTQNA